MNDWRTLKLKDGRLLDVRVRSEETTDNTSEEQDQEGSDDE